MAPHNILLTLVSETIDSKECSIMEQLDLEDFSWRNGHPLPLSRTEEANSAESPFARQGVDRHSFSNLPPFNLHGYDQALNTSKTRREKFCFHLLGNAQEQVKASLGKWQTSRKSIQIQPNSNAMYVLRKKDDLKFFPMPE